MRNPKPDLIGIAARRGLSAAEAEARLLGIPPSKASELFVHLRTAGPTRRAELGRIFGADLKVSRVALVLNNYMDLAGDPRRARRISGYEGGFEWALTDNSDPASVNDPTFASAGYRHTGVVRQSAE